jgi:hypothetical protein
MWVDAIRDYAKMEMSEVAKADGVSRLLQRKDQLMDVRIESKWGRQS